MFQQQRLERILPRIQIFEKVIQLVCTISSILISSWLCLIIFTTCDSIIFDWDLWRICLDKLPECSSNGLLVYTVVIHAKIDILYRLWKMAIKCFTSLQFSQDLFDKLQIARIFLILGVHFLFVRLWYFKQYEPKEPQTETFTLCRDSYMSATVTRFKHSHFESVCIRSLYNSMFWALLCIDINICALVPSTLIKLLLIYYEKSNVRRYTS